MLVKGATDIQPNSLAPGKCGNDFTRVFLKLILQSDILITSCEVGLRWVPQDLTDDQSTLVQVMAWCHQATSHYLIQCWARSMSPYGVTRPQWVNLMLHSAGQHMMATHVGLILAPNKHQAISNHHTDSYHKHTIISHTIHLWLSARLQ